MKSRQEAMELAVIESANGSVTKIAQQDALREARKAGVRVADYLRAHAILKAAGGDRALAEVLADDADDGCC
jgi:hypothetical protein